MTIVRSGVLACLMIGVSVIGSALAQEESRHEGDDWLALILQHTVHAGDNLAAAREEMLAVFRITELGVEVSEPDDGVQEQEGAAHAPTPLTEKWERGIWGSDRILTRAELETFHDRGLRNAIRSKGVEPAPTEEQIAQTVARLVEEDMKVDLNDDGSVVLSEALAAVVFTGAVAGAREQALQRGAAGGIADRPVYLSLDEDDDGILSESEFGRALDRVLGSIDSDGDQEFSKEEMSAFAKEVTEIHRAAARAERAARREAERRAFAISCGFPKAPDNAEVAIIAVHDGQALSTVSLGGDDVEVTVANAWIDPGQTPLYVLVSSQKAMIWRFSGAVERIAYVVANSAQRDAVDLPRVGVVGIAEDRVHIPAERDCLKHYTGKREKEKDKVVKMLPHLIGRGADIAAETHDFSTVRLPQALFDGMLLYDNAVELPKTGPGAPLWREMLTYHPGGLAQVDAEAVVSRAAARDYAVLPGHAGLAQLVEEGALEVLGTAKVVSLAAKEFVLGGSEEGVTVLKGAEPKVTRLPTSFKIMRKISYPAELGGSVVIEFVLAPGVPEPEGSPGRSTLTK